MNPELEAEVIIEACNRYEVRDVVIGAFDAISQKVRVPPTFEKFQSDRIRDDGR